MAVISTAQSTTTEITDVSDIKYSTVRLSTIRTVGTATAVVIYGNLVGGQTVYTTGSPAGGATLSWIV
jgi:hypothetical protein